jgi:hypothetical protein
LCTFDGTKFAAEPKRGGVVYWYCRRDWSFQGPRDPIPPEYRVVVLSRKSGIVEEMGTCGKDVRSYTARVYVGC